MRIALRLNAAERARFNAEPNARSGGCDGAQHRTCRGPKNAQPQGVLLASPEHVNSSAVIGARRIQRRRLHYLSEVQALRQEVQVRPGEAAPAGRRIAPPKGCGRHVSYLSGRFFKKSHRIKLAQAGADRTAACLNWSRSQVSRVRQRVIICYDSLAILPAPAGRPCESSSAFLMSSAVPFFGSVLGSPARGLRSAPLISEWGPLLVG